MDLSLVAEEVSLVREPTRTTRKLAQKETVSPWRRMPAKVFQPMQSQGSLPRFGKPYRASDGLNATLGPGDSPGQLWLFSLTCVRLIWREGSCCCCWMTTSSSAAAEPDCESESMGGWAMIGSPLRKCELSAHEARAQSVFSAKRKQNNNGSQGRGEN